MAGPMGFFKYVSDDGQTYRVRLDAGNAAAGGFEASDNTEPALPSGYEMRYVWAQEPDDGARRKIHVADVDTVTPSTGGNIWDGTTTTLSLPNFATMANDTFDIRGRVGEARYDR